VIALALGLLCIFAGINDVVGRGAVILLLYVGIDAAGGKYRGGKDKNKYE
jgi:hypothetical protein